MIYLSIYTDWVPHNFTLLFELETGKGEIGPASVCGLIVLVGRRGPVASSCSTDSNKFIYTLWHVTDLSPLYGMDKPQWQTWKVMPKSSTLLSVKGNIPKQWMATSNPLTIHLPCNGFALI